MTPAGTEIHESETHGIALQSGHRLLAHSAGRGWRNVYASVASERSWTGMLPAVPHHCVVYCLHQTASVRREIAGRDAGSAKLLPRRLAIIPGQVASHWDVVGRPDIVLLYLRDSTVKDLTVECYGDESARLSIIPRMAFVDPVLEQLARAILDLLNDKGKLGQSTADVYANAMAARLVLRHMQGTTNSDDGYEVADAMGLALKSRHICAFINASLGDDLSVARLAAEANLSPDYLIRKFRLDLGVTPHQYVMRSRIKRAQELLATTDMPLTDVAAAVGFADQSHLSTAFRKLVGVSPARYRRGRG